MRYLFFFIALVLVGNVFSQSKNDSYNFEMFLEGDLPNALSKTNREILKNVQIQIGKGKDRDVSETDSSIE